MLALGSAVDLRADYPATVLADAPLGYWRLGEMPTTFDDPVANSGSLGSAAGGLGYAVAHPVAGALAGSSDTAMEFTAAAAAPPAAASRVVMGSAESFNFIGTASFTLEAWVRPNALSGSMRVISNGSSGQGYAFGFQGNNALRITGFGVADVSSDAAPAAFPTGEWMHIAVVRDGSSVLFYTNGVQFGVAKALNNIKTTANPLVLGRNASLTEPFNGAIDEAAVFDKVLGATALAAHVTAGRTVGADYASTVLADGPIGYWRLNEPAKSEASVAIANSGSLGTAADGSVRGSLNSVVGGVPAPLVGDANTALRFDGLDGKVEIPYQAELNPTGAWSVSFWARLDGWTNAHQSPVTSRNDSGTGQRGYIFYAAPVNGNPQWQFWTGPGWNSVTGPDVVIGQWYHLVGTYDPVAKTKAFYVDGQRVGFAGDVTVNVNEAKPFRIGAGQTDLVVGNFFWNGGVDEVAVFPGVLSQERVMAQYAAALGSDPAVVNPPSIAFNPPVSLTVHSDQRVLLSSGFAGSLPMTFRWFKVSNDLTTTNEVAGATSETLEIASAQVSDSAFYFCSAANALGTADAAAVQLEVLAPQTPALVEDVPVSVPVYAGGSATLEAVFGGTPPLSYQWLSNGIPILDATNTSLTLTGVQSAWAGVAYSLQVTNLYGLTSSGVAHLNVLTASPSSYAAVMTELDPLAWWRLGEDEGTIAFDVWGGFNGRYEGATPNALPGALLDDDDGAMTLFGADSRMVVSNSAPFNFTGTNAFTLVTWARPDVLTGVQRLISNRSGTPNGGYGFGFRNNNQVRLTAFGVVDVDASVASFDLGTWYHIAAVRSSNRMDLYIDGELRNSGAVSRINSVPTPLQLGGNPTATEYFTGGVDETAVFDRALAAGDIARLYAARFGSLVPPALTVEPQANQLYDGGTANFSVVATGSQPLSYQWRSNGVAIVHATNATYSIANVTADLSGATYSVTVSNSAGTATSQGALLTVLPAYGYVEIIAADHPVALWRLGEAAGATVYDSLGGHNGNAIDFVTFGQPGALADDSNTAVTLDGVSSYVQAPSSADLNPAQFSVECWARVTGGAGVYRAAVSSRDYQAGYILYAAANNTWQFWTRAPGVGWQALTGAPVVEGEWVHLVGTFDGATKSLYLNGELAATEANPNYAPNLLRPFRIGAGNNEDDPGAGSIYPFAGDLDEVAVYSYALTPSQVSTHYGMGKYSTTTPPTLAAQLEPQTILAGAGASLTIRAAGSPPLAYQWQKDGTDLPGATSPTLTISAAYYTDAGSYRVVVRNGVGSVTSDPVSLVVMPTPSFANLTNDLVLHLKFEGDYQDTSGRANHAAPMGAPSFGPGRIGAQAFQFKTDPENVVFDYATLAVSGATPADFQFGESTDFSVAFWVKYSTSTGDPVFIGDANWNGGSQGWLISPTFGTDGLALWISDGTDFLNYNGPGGSLGGNNWHHVVGTFQRTGNVTLYLDGQVVYQASLAAIGDLNTQDLGYVLNIGQDGTGTYTPAIPDGVIDDVGLWRRALSQYEAQSIYWVGHQQGRTFDEVGPVTIQVQSVDGFIDVIWQAGTLKQAVDVGGPYTPVSAAAAPFHRLSPGGTAMFFKVE